MELTFPYINTTTGTATYTWPDTTTGIVTVQIPCPRCGGSHALQNCHQVKVIEYHEDGSIKRVEFFAPNDYMCIKVEPVFKPPYEITIASVTV